MPKLPRARTRLPDAAPAQRRQDAAENLLTVVRVDEFQERYTQQPLHRDRAAGARCEGGVSGQKGAEGGGGSVPPFHA